MPYLTPNLDDARLYELASNIKAASNTIHDIDDIYNILVNIRAYVSNDVDILSRLNDLTGYNTAYNTHSMIMDIWKRIGGNSTLGDSYTIIDLLNDIHYTFSNNIIDNGLSVSNGAETYYISEILAGIYGQFSTPRSIPDLYNKLSDIQDDLNDNFISIANDTYSINSAIQRLADIFASNDVAQAKLNQQDYEDGAIADFTGSGTGAATTANKNDIKSISSSIKSGLNTGGTANSALGVFNYNNSNWSWFTQTTKSNLDTTFISPYPNYIPYTEVEGIYNSTNRKFNFNALPAGTPCKIDVTLSQTVNSNVGFFIWDTNNQIEQMLGTITPNSLSYSFSLTPNYPFNRVYFGNFNSVPINVTIKIYVQSNLRKSINNIPDFITKHDNEYFNKLLEVNK